MTPTLLWADLTNRYIWVVLLVTFGFGLIGFYDDYLKVTKQNPKGVPGKLKLLLQVVIAGIAAVWINQIAAAPLNTSLAVPFLKDVLLNLGWFMIPFAAFVMIGASNAVNLTDGLDGLAIVPVMIAAASFGLICYLVGNTVFANYLQIHNVAGASEVIGFGEHPEAQARLVKYAPHSECSCVAAEILGHPMTFKIGAPGRHWVLNALGVLAAAHLAGADLAEAGMALAGITAPKGRGERHTIVWRDGGNIELIDDSYNASPPSMRAAYAVLAMAKPSAPRGRRIAVIGDMLELGPDAEAAHAGLAEDLVREKIDLVFAAGPLMRALYDRLPPQMRGHHAPNSVELIQPLRRAIRSGDVLLVKGSLGSRMGKIVEDLLNPAPQPRAANGW